MAWLLYSVLDGERRGVHPPRAGRFIRSRRARLARRDQRDG